MPRKNAKPRTEPIASAVEDRGADERHEVGGEDRAERLLERAVDRRAHGAPGAHLVLQLLEVDDVRVDRDTDGDDETGDPGQGQRQADRRARGTR